MESGLPLRGPQTPPKHSKTQEYSKMRKTFLNKKHGGGLSGPWGAPSPIHVVFWVIVFVLKLLIVGSWRHWGSRRRAPGLQPLKVKLFFILRALPSCLLQMQESLRRAPQSVRASASLLPPPDAGILM